MIAVSAKKLDTAGVKNPASKDKDKHIHYTPFGAILVDDEAANLDFDAVSFYENVLAPSEKADFKKYKIKFLDEDPSKAKAAVELTSHSHLHLWPSPVIKSSFRTRAALNVLISSSLGLIKSSMTSYPMYLENHEGTSNKFLYLVPGEGNFTVYWGKIGSVPKQTTYPASEYDRYVKSKFAKGYDETGDPAWLEGKLSPPQEKAAEGYREKAAAKEASAAPAPAKKVASPASVKKGGGQLGLFDSASPLDDIGEGLENWADEATADDSLISYLKDSLTSSVPAFLTSSTWALDKGLLPDFIRLLGELKTKFYDVLGDEELLVALEKAEHRAHELMAQSDEEAAEIAASYLPVSRRAEEALIASGVPLLEAAEIADLLCSDAWNTLDKEHRAETITEVCQSAKLCGLNYDWGIGMLVKKGVERSSAEAVVSSVWRDLRSRFAL